MRDRSARPLRRSREIGAKLPLRAAQGRDQAQTVIRRITGELAERAAVEAE